MRIVFFIFIHTLSLLSLGADNSIRLLQEQILSPLAQESVAESYTVLYADLDLQKNTKDTQIKFDGGGAFNFNSKNENYLNFREVYYSHFFGSASLTAGRELSDWSYGDQLWSTGLWEPQYKKDLLHTQRQGFTGLSLFLKHRQWQIKLFASSVFLPDQTPLVREENGKLISDNPWFYSPYDKVLIGDLESPLRYKLDIPPLQDVVRQPSYAFQIKNDGESFWFSVAGAYKPANQLMYALEPVHQIGISASNGVTDVTVHPISVYHSVLTSEFGLKNKNNSAWFSFSREGVEEVTVPDGWLYKRFKPQSIFSTAFQRKFYFKKIDLNVLVSWLKVSEEEVLQPDSFVRLEDSSFQFRQLFQEAYMVDLVAKIYAEPVRDFLFKARFMQDYVLNSDVLTFSSEYQIAKNFSAEVGFDILGVNDKSSSAPLYTFKNNDRVFTGIKYAF